ncbi:hypothetical protein ACFL2O_01610 [Thermodesulfobacteriota bacterium]
MKVKIASRGPLTWARPERLVADFIPRGSFFLSYYSVLPVFSEVEIADRWAMGYRQ